MTLSPENWVHFCAKLINAFLDAAADCAEWQSTLEPMSGDVLYGGLMVSQTIPSEGLVMRIQQWFPWPLDTKISPDSLNIFMILWTVDGERPKLFELTDNSLMKFGTKWWTTIHPCLQRLSLWWIEWNMRIYVESVSILKPENIEWNMLIYIENLRIYVENPRICIETWEYMLKTWEYI